MLQAARWRRGGLFLGFRSSWSNMNPILSRSPVRPLAPRRKAASRSSSVAYRVFASTVRLICPHSRSMRFRLGEYGGSQKTRSWSRVCRQELVYGLGGVETSVVAHQDDLLARVTFQQSQQEHEELGSALGRGDRVGEVARLVIDAAVDNTFFVFTRRGHFRLLSHGGPGPRQRRMAVNFHLVLKDQDSVASFANRPFFRRLSRAWAFSYAASSRLPFIVCLGRWKENPSSRNSRRTRSSLKAKRVVFFKWALSRATDQTLKPYPNRRGGVCTALRSAARYSGVTCGGRPGDFRGVSPAIPCSRYRLRTVSTVPGLHPNSLAMDRRERRTPRSDMRMIRQLRNTLASPAENRNRSNSSHCLSDNFKAPMAHLRGRNRFSCLRV